MSESKLVTLNYFMRTIVYAGIVSLAGYGVWEARQLIHKDDDLLAAKEQRIADLDQRMKDFTTEHANELDRREKLHARELAAKDRELLRVNTALKFLKMDHRLARIEILDQQPIEGEPERVRTKFMFQELGPKGEPVGDPVVDHISGKELYLDAQVIKFKDEFIEKGDELRGRSICRFRRVSLDREPVSPGDVSPFEKELWGNFWEIANSSEKADHIGVRAAHGSGLSVVMRPGAKYRVELRSSGELTIKPEVPGEIKRK